MHTARLGLVQAIHTTQCKLSDHLMNALLTMELCGSVRYMTPEDFEVLKSQINMAIESLRSGKDFTVSLEKMLTTPENKPQLSLLRLDEGAA